MELTLYTPQQAPAVTVVTVYGGIDCGAAGSERLLRILNGLLHGGERFFVFDLSGAAQVAERVLGELVGVMARARLAGGDAAFVVLAGPVLQALQTIGVPQIAWVGADREQAIDHLSKKAGETHEPGPVAP